MKRAMNLKVAGKNVGELFDFWGTFAEGSELMARIGLKFSEEREGHRISRLSAHHRVDDLVEVLLISEEKKKEDEVGVVFSFTWSTRFTLGEFLSVLVDEWTCFASVCGALLVATFNDVRFARWTRLTGLLEQLPDQVSVAI